MYPFAFCRCQRLITISQGTSTSSKDPRLKFRRPENSMRSVTEVARSYFKGLAPVQAGWDSSKTSVVVVEVSNDSGRT